MTAKPKTAKTATAADSASQPASELPFGAAAARPDDAATQPRAYDVGYGKPPVGARFRKGQSGNPAGRPPGTGAASSNASALVLEEAYRTVSMKDGRHVFAVPAIQAVVRCQVALAAKGNGPAQRALIATVQAIEQQRAADAAAEAAAAAAAPPKPGSLVDAARRIAFLLRLAREEMKNQPLTADGQPTIPPAPEDEYIKEFCKDEL